jgi:hypothetical protein
MEFAMRDNKYDIRNDKANLKTYIYFNPKKFVLTKENIQEHIQEITQEDINSLNDIKTILDYDDKIVVDPDPNEESLEVFKSYDNVQNYILNKFRYLCVGISYFYIEASFSHVDAVVIIRSSNPLTLPGVPIFGCALIYFDEKKIKNSIYIDIICSDTRTKYNGEFLIKQIEDICRTLGMNQIYLKSYKSAIRFYEKYGFIKSDDTCEDLCLMTKKLKKLIIDPIGGKKRKTKKQKKTKKTKKIKKTRKNRRF